jgi:hypothetical protein
MHGLPPSDDDPDRLYGRPTAWHLRSQRRLGSPRNVRSSETPETTVEAAARGPGHVHPVFHVYHQATFDVVLESAEPGHAAGDEYAAAARIVVGHRIDGASV